MYLTRYTKSHFRNEDLLFSFKTYSVNAKLSSKACNVAIYISALFFYLFFCLDGTYKSISKDFIKRSIFSLINLVKKKYTFIIPTFQTLFQCNWYHVYVAINIYNVRHIDHNLIRRSSCLSIGALNSILDSELNFQTI